MVKPIVKNLFHLADRGIRGSLLQRTSILEQGFGSENKDLLNKDLFEPMCSGLSDSSAPLRELTLKSCHALVKHLTPTNIDKLARYLVRLQSDPEPSIRTNAMIFIGKIMIPHIGSKEKTEKLLLPAFTRAMRPEEDFIPCRMAALKSILSCATKTKSLSPQTIAQKVLPIVVPHVLDSSSMEVRAESWKVVDSLLAMLRVESEQMNSLSITRERNQSSSVCVDATTQNVNTTATSVDAPDSSNSSGYLSRWSLWGGSTSSKIDDEPSLSSGVNDNATATASSSMIQKTPLVSSLNAQNNFNDDGGWSDEDNGDNWDDDDKFTRPTKPDIVKTSVPPTMKLKKKENQVKPTVQKLGGNVELVGDGWDDF